MINFKKMLLENRGNDPASSLGCLMAMVSPPYIQKIKEFGLQIIPEKDLYYEGEEFGRENEPHVTIKYGFTKDLTELDLRRIIGNQSTFLVEFYELNQFSTNPLFDVVILKAKSPVLNELNRRCNEYPHEDTHPGYNPHMTLAYVKKGEFNHTKENIRLVIPIKMLMYSPISGGKTFYNL